jgi:hypothetical protein
MTPDLISSFRRPSSAIATDPTKREQDIRMENLQNLFFFGYIDLDAHHIFVA